MSYLVKNVSVNRPIVCTLKDKSTLRLGPGQSETISEGNVTRYLTELAENTKLRLLTIERKKGQSEKEAKKGEEV